MNCHESEELILESLEAPLPEGRREELQAHVAACPGCRQFSQAQGRLDAALAKSIRRPRLSSGFSSRILHQVDQEIAASAAESIEARKRAAEAEFQQTLADLRKGAPGSKVLRTLDLIGLGAAGLLAGVLLSSLLPQLGRIPMPSLPTSWQGSMTYAPWVAAGLVTAAGLALGSRRDLLARLRI
jgi:hypothetical protein